jgi:hypothetical protein
MEPEGSLPCLQEPVTCPYPETVQSSPCLPILPSTPWSSKLPLSLRFLQQIIVCTSPLSIFHWVGQTKPKRGFRLYMMPCLPVCLERIKKTAKNYWIFSLSVKIWNRDWLNTKQGLYWINTDYSLIQICHLSSLVTSSLVYYLNIWRKVGIMTFLIV